MGMVGSHDPEIGPDQARVVGTDVGRWQLGRGHGESPAPPVPAQLQQVISEKAAFNESSSRWARKTGVGSY